MDAAKLENEIGNQVYSLEKIGRKAKRVKLGLREQALLSAPTSEDIQGSVSRISTNAQTGEETFRGFLVVRVPVASCVEVE
jgi:hypothetical protein